MKSTSDLKSILRNLKPVLDSEEYIFTTFVEGELPPFANKAILIFNEEEGRTFIINKETADKFKLDYSSVYCRIILNVYSDLEAVGFIAEVSTLLANNGISVNPVSAFYHDHLFVPKYHAPKALALLEQLSAINL